MQTDHKQIPDGPRLPPAAGARSASVLHTPEFLRGLRQHFAAMNDVRRGVCLLNAGRLHEAAVAFSRAKVRSASVPSLPTYLAACCVGQAERERAAALFARQAGADADPTTARIRQALVLNAAGKPQQADTTLREAIRDDPECAELHFQLGTLQAARGEYEEAELRFVQAINLDRYHTEASVSLALCCGARHAPDEALSHLQRAQARRPHDARIGLLLTQAAKAVHQIGSSARVCAVMPGADNTYNPREIAELARVVERDPDFVDAFLSIPEDEVDTDVHAMLLRTLEVALERQPEQAELHFHCGQVLQRLGRCPEAIDANERAVGIDPKYTRALIELGKLYAATDRTADATARLEQAVAAGADYADVYYLLGNLYRDQGRVTRARAAYGLALRVNNQFDEARRALAAIAT